MDFEKLNECISEQGCKTCHDQAGENVASLDSHFTSICFNCHAQR
ncbi:cytochrome c3 family protein [Ochrobactrum sp. MC-1LL]